MYFWYGTCAIVAGIGVGYYFGLNLWIKRKVEKMVVDMVIKNAENQEDGFEICDDGKCACIKFMSAGKSHNIYVPYDRKLMIKALGTQVFLVKDGKSIDITHKLGVPYLSKAHELGGSHYQVFKRGNKKDLNPDELPFQDI